MLTLKNMMFSNVTGPYYREREKMVSGLMRHLAVCSVALILFLQLLTLSANAMSLPDDAPQMIREQVAAAHQRDEDAMYQVAIYLRDQSVEDQDELARHAFGWALLAARNGHPQAAELTGVMYRQGFGIPQNYVKSRKWLERALARKSAEPNFELALLYADDENPGVDKTKAAVFLAESIRQTEPRACLISARNKLRSGIEFRKILTEITCAAEGGLVDAMEMLGDYNSQKKSPYAAVRAREWLTRAIEAGSPTAADKLLMLENKE